MKADWEAKLTELEKTMLRISGAMQALEELAPPKSEQAGMMEPRNKRQPTPIIKLIQAATEESDA